MWSSKSSKSSEFMVQQPETTCSDENMINDKPKKNVSFGNSTYYPPVEPAHDEIERLQCWFTKDELKIIRTECLSLLELIEASGTGDTSIIDTDLTCGRGLEDVVAKQTIRARFVKKMATMSDFQHMMEVHDPEELRNFSVRESKKANERALSKANKDEQIAKKIYKESFFVKQSNNKIWSIRKKDKSIKSLAKQISTLPILRLTPPTPPMQPTVFVEARTA